MKTFLNKLFATANATTQEGDRFNSCQEYSGYYKAGNGFFYYLGWNNNRQTQAGTGYSLDFINAERHYQDKFGPSDPRDEKSTKRYQQFISEQLGLDRVPDDPDGCLCCNEACPVHAASAK